WFSASATLQDPNPLLSRHLQFLLLDLLEEAERIRASLAALAAFSVQADPCNKERSPMLAFIAEIASVLAFVGRMLTAHDERPVLLIELKKRIARCTIAADPSWRWSAEALLGQIRSVERLLASMDAITTQRATEVAANDRTPTDRAGDFG